MSALRAIRTDRLMPETNPCGSLWLDLCGVEAALRLLVVEAVGSGVGGQQLSHHHGAGGEVREAGWIAHGRVGAP